MPSSENNFGIKNSVTKNAIVAAAHVQILVNVSLAGNIPGSGIRG